MNDIAEIEAILFVSGEEGVTLSELARLTDSTADHVVHCLQKLKHLYSDKSHGIMLIETAKAYKLVTKKQYESSVRRYAHSPLMKALSKALIETVAIIAYKQPITRMEIEAIRGVSVSSTLAKLSLRGLIQETGRLEAPGNPVLYGTTSYFLDYFGLCDISELPDIAENNLIEEIQLFDGDVSYDERVD